MSDCCALCGGGLAGESVTLSCTECAGGQVHVLCVPGHAAGTRSARPRTRARDATAVPPRSHALARAGGLCRGVAGNDTPRAFASD